MQPPSEAPEEGGLDGVPPELTPNMTSNLQLSHAQIEEVVSIMRMNVDKVLERDVKELEMDHKAEALEASASVFESSAAKLKRKYWLKNYMVIMLGVICAIVIVAIIRKYHMESDYGVREPPAFTHVFPFT
ncbi:LOW QUALITY PROTEIN: vesicle-associated membrane protein 1 [Carettochelys insculpta]|uniref:LOW QUALITY PROTEIN: vesicle-associated membrane protein 1 n=1 Tax=Carettochelys insculpta TaxID=44489 RepID=UPI003EC06BBA